MTSTLSFSVSALAPIPPVPQKSGRPPASTNLGLRLTHPVLDRQSRHARHRGTHPHPSPLHSQSAQCDVYSTNQRAWYHGKAPLDSPRRCPPLHSYVRAAKPSCPGVDSTRPARRAFSFSQLPADRSGEAYRSRVHARAPYAGRHRG